MPYLFNKGISSPDLETLLSQYDLLREREKAAKDGKEKIAKQLKEMFNVLPVDPNGNKMGESDQFVYGLNMRTKTEWDLPLALAYFKSMDLKEAIKTIETIDDVVVKSMVDDGTISEDELRKLVSTSETPTLVVKRKAVASEMPEVEVAASTKKSDWFGRK